MGENNRKKRDKKNSKAKKAVFERSRRKGRCCNLFNLKSHIGKLIRPLKVFFNGSKRGGGEGDGFFTQVFSFLNRRGEGYPDIFDNGLRGGKGF